MRIHLPSSESKTRVTAIGFALVCVLLGAGATAGATPIVDQEFACFPCNEASVQPQAIGPSYGQTFTVGLSGLFVGADLGLDAVRSGRTVNDVLVEVTTVAGGFPTSNVLASGVVSGTSIPVLGSSLLFTHVDFVSGIPITPGQQLALLFSGEGPNNANILIGGPSASYARGEAVLFSGRWLPAALFFFGPGTTADFVFRTDVERIPEPTSLLLMASALGLLAFHRAFKPKGGESSAAMSHP